MKKKVTAAIVAVLLVSTIAGFGYVSQDKEVRTPVKLAEVSQGDIQSYLFTTGTIESKQIKEYYGTQARIKEINIKIGESVKAGDVLVTYETKDLQSSVKQAEIQYNNSVLQKQELDKQNQDLKNKKNDLNQSINAIETQAQQIINRIQQLEKKNDSTAAKELQNLYSEKTKLDQQKSTLVQQRDSIELISKEKLQQAQNSINLSKISVDTAKQSAAENVGTIVAEFDGVVTGLNAVEGAMSNGTMPVVTVKKLDDLKVLVELGKHEARDVQMDQKAVIRSAGKRYEGVVSYIAPSAEKSQNIPGETTLIVEVDVLDKQSDLKIGFDVDIDIMTGEEKNVVLIPAESIKIDKNGKSFVYIVQDGRVEQREIKLGLQSETDVQIVEGVQKGTKVVLNPSDEIKDGSFVVEENQENKKQSIEQGLRSKMLD